MQRGPDVIGDAQRLISLCRKMRGKVAKILSNRTGLHHVRRVKELNTGVRHNPPLIAKDGNLGDYANPAINYEGVLPARTLLSVHTRRGKPVINQCGSFVCNVAKGDPVTKNRLDSRLGFVFQR
jgi:hypothetical protein